MVEFLHKILPTTGIIIVGQQLEKGFKHFFHETVDDAWTRIQALDKAGHTVFVAQASFKTPENRRKDNVKLIRSFWMDIDCGEGKPCRFAYVVHNKGEEVLDVDKYRRGCFCRGYGWVTSYSPQAPASGTVKASITITIDGDIDTVEPSA